MKKQKKNRLKNNIGGFPVHFTLRNSWNQWNLPVCFVTGKKSYRGSICARTQINIQNRFGYKFMIDGIYNLFRKKKHFCKSIKAAIRLHFQPYTLHALLCAERQTIN